MTTPRYIRTPDGRLVATPTPVSPLTPPREAVADNALSDVFEMPEGDDLSDLVDVSDETGISAGDVVGGGDADMSDDVLEPPEAEVDDGISDLFEVTDEDVGGEAELNEEDIEDLFGVSEEDIMGHKPKPQKPKIRRTKKQFPSPPTTLGGMR